MSSAMLNIRVVQPRMMTLKQAADYLGIPFKKFRGVCSVSSIAMPGGVEVYDVRDLDNWVDQIKSGVVDADDEILSRLDKKAI